MMMDIKIMSEVNHEKYPDVAWKWQFMKVADADE